MQHQNRLLFVSRVRLVSVLMGMLALLTSVILPSAFAAPGDLLWQDRFDAAGGWDFPQAIAADQWRVFVVGYATRSADPGGNDLTRQDGLVRAYDATTGVLLWQDFYDYAGGFDAAWSVATDGQHTFVAGRAATPSVQEDFIIRAYDAASGALLWNHRVDKGGDFEAAEMIVVEHGTVYVAGHVSSVAGAGPDGADLFVQAYEAATGVLLWERQFDLANYYDAAASMAVEKGRVFVCGWGAPEVCSWNALLGRSICSGGPWDWLVRAYDGETGTLLWEDVVDGGGFDQGLKIAAAGRRVFAAGLNSGTFYVRAYEAETGAILWNEARAGELSGAWVGGLAATRQMVYASGYIQTPLSQGMWLVRAFDARSGALAWEDEFERATTWSLADGLAYRGHRVYVAGQVGEADGTSFDYLFRAYDSRNGALLWEDAFGTPGASEVAEFVATAAGRVFVAGYVQSPAGDYDMIVRAYVTDYTGIASSNEALTWTSPGMESPGGLPTPWEAQR